MIGTCTQRQMGAVGAACGAARARILTAGAPGRPLRAAAPVPSRRSSRLISRAGLVTEVDAEGLEAEIVNRTVPLVVDFYATWCGPCVLMSKEMEKVAKRLGGEARCLKIDVDKNQDISSALRIEGLPTLVFVGTDPEKPALRVEGMLPADQVVDIVRRELLGEGGGAEGQPAA